MKAKYIIGSIIVVIFIVWGASAFFKTTVKYVSFDEARQAPGTVQIVGGIDFKSVEHDADGQRMSFNIYDLEEENINLADRMKIIYEGVVPGNFDQATSVLVRGKWSGDGFAAEKLLVKCPSKYQGLDAQ